MRPKSPVRSGPSSPRRNNSSSNSKSGGLGIARILLYLVGIGCFVHVIFVGPPRTTPVPPPLETGVGETSRPGLLGKQDGGGSSNRMDEEPEQASNKDSDDDGMDKVEDSLPAQVAEKVALVTTAASAETMEAAITTTATTEAAATETATKEADSRHWFILRRT